MTYVVWIDIDGRWHCYSVGWFNNSLADGDARRMAQVLTGNFEGTDAILSEGVAAYCVHAPSRSRAISLVKQANKKMKQLNSTRSTQFAICGTRT